MSKEFSPLVVFILGLILVQVNTAHTLAGKETDEVKPVTQISENLIRNDGFEKGALKRFPEEWQVSMCADYSFNVNGPSAKRAGKNIYITDEQAHSGLRCVGFQSVNGGIKQYIPVEEGKKYVFKMWIKCKDLKGINDVPILCWVGFRNLVGKTIKGGIEPDARQIRDTKNWTLITAECTVPVGAIDAFITIFGHGSSGMVWIDDISLVAKEECHE